MACLALVNTGDACLGDSPLAGLAGEDVKGIKLVLHGVRCLVLA